MRKIWNRPSQTIWSLSTVDKNGVGNMNICTYVSSVSMKPKLIMVAIYQSTKTHANINLTKRAVLQLLSEELAPVTRICGHQSGNTIDKIKCLSKRYEISTINQLPYFKKSAGYLELSLKKLIKIDGDHDLGIFEVISHKNIQDSTILTTDYLRNHGLLR